MTNLTTDIQLELHVPDFELVKKFYGDLGFEVVWERKPQEKKGTWS
jgi:predicted lactoylglutathione lyase